MISAARRRSRVRILWLAILSITLTAFGFTFRLPTRPRLF